MAPPTRSQTQSSAQPRRNPGLRLACRRCQRRKIRCDGELPQCKRCRNAGAACVDGESARLTDLSQGHTRALNERIQWLESIVSHRCPDIDLTQGPDINAENQDALDDLEGGSRRVLDDTAMNTTSNPTSSPNIPPTAPNHNDPPRPALTQPIPGTSSLSHEIGLVSLGVNQDPRYIGPSSGHLLARVMLTKSSIQHNIVTPPGHEASFPTQLVEAVQGPLPLPGRDMAGQLCDAYFDVVHLRYPVLHRPTFLKMLDQAYEQEDMDPVIGFQAFMVMAIGATILSGRLKARIPAESYCLSALQHLDNLNVENSLKGLQCLLLLLIFTMHNPHVRLNVWYLNYHCIAALLDLGLQRDMTAQPGISLLEQEMRTRIFWVVYMLDRSIATMMGRPIGLRDEACDLRLPQGLDDSVLSSTDQTSSTIQNGTFTPMSYSVHLFRLAKLNSEIKYVAHSVTRQAPKYAYPTIINIYNWQSDMLQRLDDWAANIPSGGNPSTAEQMILFCRLRYHSLCMRLLRPSPAIPKPSLEAFERWHDGGRESIRLLDRMYRGNWLVHSWMTFHSLVMSTLAMLYCIKAVPSIAQRTQLDVLMGDLSIGLSILSATGEHWSGAKRCRNILDDLGRSTIRWLRESSTNRGLATAETSPLQPLSGADTTRGPTYNTPTSLSAAEMPSLRGQDGELASVSDPFDEFLASGEFGGGLGASDCVNIDHLIQDLFEDFIPIYPGHG